MTLAFESSRFQSLIGEKDNSAFNLNPCFCLSLRHYTEVEEESSEEEGVAEARKWGWKWEWEPEWNEAAVEACFVEGAAMRDADWVAVKMIQTPVRRRRRRRRRRPPGLMTRHHTGCC